MDFYRRMQLDSQLKTSALPNLNRWELCTGNLTTLGQEFLGQVLTILEGGNPYSSQQKIYTKTSLFLTLRDTESQL